MALAKLHLWHQQLMDAMILHPRITRSELAAMFNTSENYITNLTGTDMFQLQLDKRRAKMAEDVEKTALERLNGKVAVLAEAAVDRLTDAMLAPDVNLDGVRDTCDMALKALGYGGSSPSRAAPVVQNTVFVLDQAALAKARETMRAAAAIDVTPPALPAA